MDVTVLKFKVHCHCITSAEQEQQNGKPAKE